MSTLRNLAIGGASGLLALLLAHPEAAESRPQHGGSWVGLTLPSRVAAVAPEQSGAIVEIAKREGEVVAAGEVLFRLSSGIQRLEVERLEALEKSGLAVEKARQKLEYHERSAERLKDLARRKISSEKELEEQEFAKTMAKAEYELAVFDQQLQTLKLKQAKLRLEQRTVRSPVDGRVTTWHKQPGEAVKMFEPVIEVARFDPLWIEFDCPILDQRWFQPGKLVTVAPALGEASWRNAEVVFAAMQATASSHTFRVRLSVPNPKHDWKSGQKMQIEKVEAHAAPPGKAK